MFPFKQSLIVLALVAAFSADAVAQDTKSESVPPSISLANASKVRKISEIPRDVRRLVLGPHSGQVSVLGWETSVEVCDAQSFRTVKQIAADRKLLDLAVTRDGNTYAWSENATHVEIRNDRAGKSLRLETGNRQPSVEFSSDGKLLATGGYGLQAMIWDSTTGELVRFLNAGPREGGLTTTFSPDCRLVAVGNRNGETRVYEVATGKLLHALPREQSQELRFSPNGKVLAVAYVDGSIGLWDVADGKLLYSRTGAAQEVYTLDWSPAGDVLVTAGLSGKIILWDSRDLTALKELEAPEWVIQARFSPEGNRLLTCGGAILPSESATRKVVIWGITK